MKSYKELIVETLNQRSIIDNRQVVNVSDVSQSVLIAFAQACLDMLNLHNWVWNNKEETFVNDIGQNEFPMPYGVVHNVIYKRGSNGEKCPLEFVSELTATEGCPTQWTHDWANETILVAPAVSADCDEVSTTTIQYHDKNIACVGDRTKGILLPEFRSVDISETTDAEGNTITVTPDNQYLNVPEYIYDAYAKCVVLRTRVLLNEGAQPTVFQAQKDEFNNAYNNLLQFARTPFYKAQRIVI